MTPDPDLTPKLATIVRMCDICPDEDLYSYDDLTHQEDMSHNSSRDKDSNHLPEVDVDSVSKGNSSNSSHHKRNSSTPKASLQHQSSLPTPVTSPPTSSSSPKERDTTTSTLSFKPHNQTLNSNADSNKDVDLCIYLKSGEGLHFTISGGKYASADELRDLVISQLNLPNISKEVFSLWLSSPLLEVQLKGQHIPFRLVQQWKDLAYKYSTASEKNIALDEPVLMFQRNVFLSRRKEKKITDKDILKLLYAEAKQNILSHRYPASSTECDVLAGIQAVIDHGPHKPNLHTPTYFRKKTNEYLPQCYCVKSWFSYVKGSLQPEERIAEQYRYMSVHCHVEKLYRRYLEECWKLPYYGSAKFDGYCEISSVLRPNKLKLQQVYIYINKDGITIFNRNSKKVLMALPYSDLSWDCAELSVSSPVPCIFLQFEDGSKEKQGSKMIAVYSKQAVIMDALIDKCVQIIKKKPTDQESLKFSKVLSKKDLKKLKLIIFDKNGNCVGR